MIDIKFLRENPDVVRENIKKKFQDAKLPLVDEVIELDAEKRATQQKADSLRASRNKLSKQIGALMGQGKREEAEQVKAQVKAQSDELIAAEAKEKAVMATQWVVKAKEKAAEAATPSTMMPTTALHVMRRSRSARPMLPPSKTMVKKTTGNSFLTTTTLS